MVNCRAVRYKYLCTFVDNALDLILMYLMNSGFHLLGIACMVRCALKVGDLKSLLSSISCVYLHILRTGVNYKVL